MWQTVKRNWEAVGPDFRARKRLGAALLLTGVLSEFVGGIFLFVYAEYPQRSSLWIAGVVLAVVGLTSTVTASRIWAAALKRSVAAPTKQQEDHNATLWRAGVDVPRSPGPHP
jgi:putative Mn2+ efflux pump MntP